MHLDRDSRKVSTVYFEKGSEKQVVSYLYDINYNDTQDEVITKIGVPPFLKHSNLVQKAVNDRVLHLTFILEGINIGIWFNKANQLVSFSYTKVEDFYKDHLNWKSSLSTQNLNTTINIESFKKQSPTHLWRKRLAENEQYRDKKSENYIEDYWFTPERLLAVESIIENYLESLSNNCAENRPIAVEESLSSAIKELNEFNQTTNMIETDEREELCPFFDKTIRATGIRLPSGFDPTLIYRDW
ncbi:hypothetical protein MHTCC0001_35850 [Flavobacteriaceae bacterium MHTCC 0001]